MPTHTGSMSRPFFYRSFALAAALVAAYAVLALPAKANSIGDFVWRDVNTNALQDVGEPGLPNVLVTLYNNADTQAVVSTITDANGFYSFTNIANGNYFVAFIPPQGYFFTSNNVGGNDNIDNDAAENGTTTNFAFNITAPAITNIDAGLVLYQPSITLTKLAGDAAHGTTLYVTNGTFVEYTYIVTNNGNTYLEILQIIDDQLDLIYTLDAPCTVGFLEPGESIAFTSAPVQITVSVTNIAEVAALPKDFKCQDLPGFDPVSAIDTAVVAVVTPGYTLVKSQVSPTNRPAAIGETLVFSLTLVNTGDVDLATIPLQDLYDTSILSYLGAVPPSDDNVNDGVINWANVGPLVPGASTSVFVSFTAVASTVPGQSTNRVVATPSTPPEYPDVPPSTNDLPYTTVNPVVQIVKSVVSPAGRPAAIGEQVVFAIAVQNAGDIPLDVVPVQDTYNTALLSYLNATPASDDNVNDGVIDWANVGPLGVGGGITITARFTAVAAGIGTNVVVTTPTTTNSVPVPPQTSSVPHEAEREQLALIKRVVSPVGRPAVIGEQVAFSIIVTNVGNVPVAIVPLQDVYATNLLAYVGAVPPSDDNVNDGVINWANVGPLDVGGSVTVTSLFTAVTNGIGTNIVITTGTTNDIPYTNVNPVVQITKTVVSPTGRPAVLGEQVVFAIAVVNAGDVTLDVVPVQDTYNTALLAYQNATPPSVDNVNDGVINWANVGPILAGNSVTITARFTAVAAGTGTNVVVTIPTTTNSIPVPPRTNEVPHESVAGTIGDRVWRDLNSDGQHNENLAIYGRNDVTVRLFQVSGGVTSFLAQTVTVTDGGSLQGFYLFTNLAVGTYVVRVDTNGFPTNYAWLATTPLQYSRTIADTNITFLDCDFGFNANPTPVVLQSFGAQRVGGAVALSWVTGAEWDNLGFHVYRSAGAAGERVRLTADLIPGLGDSGGGNAYEFIDADADPAVTWYYWLEDVSRTLATKQHGPAIVAGEGADVTDALVGSFDIDASGGGLFRISWEALAQAGVGADTLVPDQVKVVVNGREVAAFVSGWYSTLRRGDYILFYVPDTEGAVSCEIRTGAEAKRMGEVYAGPVDGGGATWQGVATEDGTLLFDVTPAWERYLLAGFAGQDVLVLDVTDAQAPQVLFGYARLHLSGETGVYLSHAPDGGYARCLAIEPGAVRDVTNVRLP